VALLPAVVHFTAAESAQMEGMQATLKLLAAEAHALQPGGEIVITRLANILVIQAIRGWIATDPAARTGWLGALRDPQIGHALALIHRDPARDWTNATLAREVAMSRSAFAARFAACVNEPVQRYIARWRMHGGLTWLQEDGLAVGELASRLGYRSEAAFNRAFKRHIGVTPGAVKQLGYAHADGAPRDRAMKSSHDA
jgi:AraC-like DNA-binding protein